MNITIIVIVVLGVIFFLIYNSLISKKNSVENAFASIDTICKKRYDLIPNLVATVKQYMEHEANVLTEVTELRAKATSGNVSEDEQVELNSKIGAGLGRIMVAVEAYPDLKANENFQQLQRTLNEVEEQLSAARRSYNAAVTDFNNAVEMFPTNIVANMMHYSRRQLFEASESERQNVSVGNLFNG